MQKRAGSQWPRGYPGGLSETSRLLFWTWTLGWSTEMAGDLWSPVQWSHSLPQLSFFKEIILLFWVLVTACRTLNWDMWDLVPWPGDELGPPALGMQSLSSGPPGKSQGWIIIIFIFWESRSWKRFKRLGLNGPRRKTKVFWLQIPHSSFIIWPNL